MSDWRYELFRAMRSPRRCAIAVDAPARSENTKGRCRNRGADADGLLLERDRLLYRPDVDFASADMAYCACPIAIGRERHLVFADRLPAPAHGAQELTFGKMRKQVAGRCDRSVQQGLAATKLAAVFSAT